MNMQTPSLLDHIYCNNSTSNIISGSISYDISDHNPVFVMIPKNKVSPASRPPCEILKRDFLNFSEVDFLDSLTKGFDKSNLGNNFSDPEAEFSEFLNIFLECLETHAPKQKLSRKKIKFYFKPWLTKTIQKSIKEKNRLYQISCKHSHTYIYYKKYKQYNNILTHVKQQSKQNYFQYQFELNKNNSKNRWKMIKNIIRKPPSDSLITNIKCPESNKDLFSPKDISSCLNNYFTSIAAKLANSLPKTSPSKPLNTVSTCSSLFIKPVIDEDIIREINLLDNCKCDDTYDIPVKILKLSKNVIAFTLCYLINNCINKGVFPSPLKIAKVLPIYKGGDRDIASNYRPISILPHFSKIFEKILKHNLTDFINKYKIISENQYGFQENKSTSDALIELENYLRYQQANNKITCGIFLDLKKAFDTVDHTVLKQKLIAMGIRGLPFDLISSYLANRYQFTCINSTKSDKNLINHGVPQGSVLGPVLFLLYINDLPNVSSLKTLLFADDTALFASGNNSSSVEKVVNEELKKIENWLLKNKLTLNTQKSSTIMFGEKKTENNMINIHINNSQICQKDEVKYLGIVIDKNLKWKPHIDKLTTQISQSVGMLYHLKKYLSFNSLKLVYHALIKSRLQYGIVLWGNANQSTLKNLNKMHNRAIRYISMQPYRTRLNKLYAFSKLLKVNELYQYSAMKFMFRLYNDREFKDKIPLVNEIHAYNTRQSSNNNIFISNFLACKSSNSLRVNCMKMWNKLPINIRTEQRIKPFNRLLYQYLLDTYEI